MNFIKSLFKIEKSPARGLLPIEWLVLAYMALTLLVVLFTCTQLQNPQSMLWGRVRIGATTLALWAAYRLVPCRLTRAARVMTQIALLAWWYPDTYELNRVFDNLDHVFAALEQQCFGCQPAMLFAAALPQRVASELMCMGYASYYPMIAAVVVFYFVRRYGEFERVSFVLLATFFAYYVVFIFVPVAGPTFYFKAVPLSDAAHGVFPALHGYFNTHTECLPTPGWSDGFFYHLVEQAKAAGERPTAAFPSSHVSVSTVCMLLAWHSGSRRLVWVLAPFYVLLVMSTVYIQAHYAVDAVAGFVTAVPLYFLLMAMTGKRA